MMFIGRKAELEKLEALYKKRGFQFVIMYGRRRVGKTTLMLEFCKNKPSIFFVAEEYNDKIALQKFSEKIFEFFKINDFMSAFESWEKAFLFLAKQAAERRLVVVMDEFPYIVSANKSIPSILQNLIDHHLNNSQLFLIICGSSLSFMEKEILSYKSPLYGRRTSQFSIEPFGFYDSIKFFKSYSAQDKVKAYSIAGGIPQYLLKLDESLSIKENIILNFLDKTSYLHEEPKNLLKQELREPALYNSIIEAIAKGASKLNDISTKIGEDNDKCAKYIRTLIELKVIEKETPIIFNNSKKSVYKIKDNLFRFWYRFVFPNIELIEQGMYEYLYEALIKKEIDHYIGPIFEEICIEFLTKKNKKMDLPFVFSKIGRWWGNNPVKKQQEEIDIIAFSGDKAIFGECKWRNEPLSIQVINELIEKSTIFNFKEKYYFIFSKSGFYDEVIAKTRSNDSIKLFTLEEILE